MADDDAGTAAAAAVAERLGGSGRVHADFGGRGDRPGRAGPYLRSRRSGGHSAARPTACATALSSIRQPLSVSASRRQIVADPAARGDDSPRPSPRPSEMAEDGDLVAGSDGTTATLQRGRGPAWPNPMLRATRIDLDQRSVAKPAANVLLPYAILICIWSATVPKRAGHGHGRQHGRRQHHDALGRGLVLAAQGARRRPSRRGRLRPCQGQRWHRRRGWWWRNCAPAAA